MSTTTSKSPISFSGSFYFLSIWLLLNASLSIAVNSIYIHNYMSRRQKRFEYILTDGEKSALWTTFGISLFSILLMTGILIYKVKKSGETKVCPLTIKKEVEETKDGGKKVKEMKEVRLTAKEVSTSGCTILPECANATEHYSNERASADNKICTPREFGTTNLCIVNIIVAFMGLFTSSLLWYDITVRKAYGFEVPEVGPITTPGITTTRPPTTTPRPTTVKPGTRTTTTPKVRTCGDISECLTNEQCINGICTYIEPPPEKAIGEGTAQSFYIMCLIFAIVSGAIPLVLFTYIWAKRESADSALVEVEKTVERIKEVKGKVSVADCLNAQVTFPESKTS